MKSLGPGGVDAAACPTRRAPGPGSQLRTVLVTPSECAMGGTKPCLEAPDA